MKKINVKEILILVIATAVIAIAAFTVWQLLFPSTKATTKSPDEKITAVSTDIDQTTLKRIDSLSDYGQPNLDNIGKTDLFVY